MKVKAMELGACDLHRDQRVSLLRGQAPSSTTLTVLQVCQAEHSPDRCLLQSSLLHWLPTCQKQPSRWLAGLPVAALRCPDSNQ